MSVQASREINPQLLYEQEREKVEALESEYQISRTIISSPPFDFPGGVAQLILDYSLQSLNLLKHAWLRSTETDRLSIERRCVERINAIICRLFLFGLEITEELDNIVTTRTLENEPFIKCLANGRYNFIMDPKKQKRDYSFKEIKERIEEFCLGRILCDALGECVTENQEQMVLKLISELLSFFDSGKATNPATSFTCLAAQTFNSRLFALSLLHLNQTRVWIQDDLVAYHETAVKIGETYKYCVIQSGHNSRGREVFNLDRLVYRQTLDNSAPELCFQGSSFSSKQKEKLTTIIALLDLHLGKRSEKKGVEDTAKENRLTTVIKKISRLLGFSGVGTVLA